MTAWVLFVFLEEDLRRVLEETGLAYWLALLTPTGVLLLVATPPPARGPDHDH